MALDPEMGFIPSFIGFTLGVGLCEELCKAIPILIYYKIGNKQTWRGAFLWGLASGAGFGVSEGIMYSADFYNGLSGPGIYVVRFVSCVALHAIWSGSVGISVNQRQYLLQQEEEHWIMYVVSVLRMIAIPMVLHGLYDTLLKKELEFLALLVAAASFGYLAWQISRLRTSDDEDERAAYVGQYIRSKILAQRG
jgi:RsiW-degrading membrane proteinase PrsW (M82 family)